MAYVLEGSVQRVDNKVHVTGQLIDSRTDRHVWAKSFDRELSDIFAIQAEIAKAIAGELQAVISPQAAKLLDRKPTENPAAYDKFLQARALRNSAFGRPDSWQKEQTLLEEAVVLDGKFAIAWAWLANIHGLYYSFNRDHSPGRLAKAKAAIDAAVRLAPDEPDVILNGGHFMRTNHDIVGAIEQYERVAQLQPDAAEWRKALGSIQRMQGKWAEALANYRRATQIEPHNTDASQLLLGATLAVRRFDEAIVESRRLAPMAFNPLQFEYVVARISFLMRGSTQEMDAFFAGLSPEQAKSDLMSGYRRAWAVARGEALPPEDLQRGNAMEAALVLAASGDLAAARARIENSAAPLRDRLKSEPENATVLGNLARIEAVLGHNEEALRLAQRALELTPESVMAPSAAERRADLAFVYAWTGVKESAIAEYAHLLRTPLRGTGILENVHVMKHHSAFAPLRGDPRFEALLDDPRNNAPLF